MSEQTQPQLPQGDIQFGDHASIAGDVFTGGKVVQNYFLAEKKRPEVQVDLLHKMQQSWILGLREHALRQTQPIPLAKELEFKVVDRPQDLVMASPQPQSRILSYDTKMMDIFNSEEVGHALLILGEPGSGKTIAMLELASAAIEVAENDI